MSINTTKTIERASTALGEKCEKTLKDMKTLLRRCGAADVLSMVVDIPEGPAPKDDVLYIGLNAVDFYFRRGTSVEMPFPLIEIAVNTGHLPKRYKKLMAEKTAAVAAEKAAAEAAAKTEEPATEQKTTKKTTKKVEE